ncbi:MAG: hypothetical protein V4450_09900 [Bacteroidota bacterium]
MKFLVIVMFMIPFTLAGQTVKSYQQSMEKFKKFYNAGKGDSINAMFGPIRDEFKSMRPLWTNDQSTDFLNEYGTLQSFKFIGIDTTDPNKVYVFKTVFSKKGINATSLTLDKNNHLGTFRFITTSDEITLLLKNSLNRR